MQYNIQRNIQFQQNSIKLMSNVYLMKITKFKKQSASNNTSRRDKTFFVIVSHIWLPVPPTTLLKFWVHKMEPQKFLIIILYLVSIYGSSTISVMSCIEQPLTQMIKSGIQCRCQQNETHVHRTEL